MAVLTGDIEGVTNKEIMELLLVTQYFDMVKDVGSNSKNSTLFMTHSPSAINQVATQLRAALSSDQDKPGSQKMKR